MNLLGFLIADLFVGSILHEQQNTQEEIKKLREQLQNLEEKNEDH